MSTSPLSSDQALLRVAIDAFGRHGLEGASTRDIAGAAGKPMSAITYHFGGKEGLYLACAQYIADTIAAMIAPALSHVAALCRADDSPAQARAALSLIFSRFVQTMVSEDTAHFARFIMREQMEPSEAFDILYGGIMGAMLTHIADLLMAVSRQRIGIAEARVRTIALMGQVMAFRVAHAAVMRSTGWAGIGGAQADAINQTIQRHLAAILDALEAGDDQ
ncbi:CerR family C-terminal domain-containing protein [Sphingomonas sp. 28-63-12]|uniref:CerR family C-terminal domain-containing protein n=1 Tax=Sphingomonas sp. 28-63-12 TaxID=1970434 RepID=UPI000BD3E473|nr:MAG: hypothetical protein B7Y47_14890 [Sphingomonas sp. 28-63-12]